MSDPQDPPRSAPPHVPLLTEIIEVGVDSMLPADADADERDHDAAPTDAPSAGFDEAAVVQRVLQDVQGQIDLMLEYRLREAIAPMLSRLSLALASEMRDELASLLRDVVARAVARELSRQRQR